MADYYSLLARAVANLPKSSPPATRRAIYERARKALTNQLRSLKPQLPESDIAREERALDDAVARLEAEFEPASAGEVHTLPIAVAAPAVAPPPAPPAAPPRPPRPAPPAVRPAIPPQPPRPATPPARPSLPPSLPAATAFTPPPPLGGAEAVPAAPTTPAAAPEPMLAAPSRAEPESATLAPPVSRYEREPTRPMLADPGRRKAPTWLWVSAAVAVGFAGSIAVVALAMRPALQDLSQPAPVDQPNASGAQTQEKSLTRVGKAAPAETPLASASPTAEPSATAPPSPAAAAPAPSPTPSVEASPPAPAETPSAHPTPSAATPTSAATAPVASRAAMLVATVADAAKPQIVVGDAVWSIVPAPPGQPAALGVKSEIDIPDLKLHASMILRKNFDQNLPASHTIDLRVTFDAGSPIKGIKDIALPLMRRDDPPAADALTGVRVKISDNYFLVGLNRADADVSRNVQMIAERAWFDFPMQLDDDRIAKLTFEKGGDGEKIIAQALAAWK